MRNRSTPPDQEKAERLSTLPRVARANGIGVRPLREAVKAGEIPVFMVGSWPRVRPSDVGRWIESRRRA